MKKVVALAMICSLIVICACNKDDKEQTPADLYPSVKATFGTKIDPAALLNYAGQTKPAYIVKDNSGGNPITNAKATLGRVLFYDKNLSKRRPPAPFRITRRWASADWPAGLISTA